MRTEIAEKLKDFDFACLLLGNRVGKDGIVLPFDQPCRGGGCRSGRRAVGGDAGLDFAVARGKGEQGGNAEGKVSGFHTVLRDVGNRCWKSIGIRLFYCISAY